MIKIGDPVQDVYVLEDRSCPENKKFIIVSSKEYSELIKQFGYSEMNSAEILPPESPE